MDEWIDRRTALTRLGVRQQTLYAYVSRGLIERRVDPADPRRSLYRADDVAVLVARRRRGRGPAAIAASAVAWGEPIIPTSISTVSHGRLVVRGEDLVDLAARATFEEVAALLWQLPTPPRFDVPAVAADPFQALAALAAQGRATIGRPTAKLIEDAAQCVAALVAALGGAAGDPALPVHTRLAAAWQVSPAGAEAMRKALVVLADHELNPSTFAVRVAAATGASLAASLLAGLGALSGPRHGGAGAALASLIGEAERIGAADAVALWLARGHGLPGFGHTLYPSGDPRARCLLQDLAPDATLSALRQAVADATGDVPNIDFALQALTRQHGLPADAPFRLFAIGRSIGWAAHAIEQAESGAVIRPRATYQGVLPPSRP
jgi:citrate synthase